jgi:hypothetical protein
MLNAEDMLKKILASREAIGLSTSVKEKEEIYYHIYENEKGNIKIEIDYSGHYVKRFKTGEDYLGEIKHLYKLEKTRKDKENKNE